VITEQHQHGNKEIKKNKFLLARRNFRNRESIGLRDTLLKIIDSSNTETGGAAGTRLSAHEGPMAMRLSVL
jgi:hypothetical protein